MTTDNDLFSNPDGTGQNPVEGNVLEALVGDGKKFKDNEALARGKIESDTFIQRLQSEMEELRQELNTRVTLEEFMEKMNQQGSPNPSINQSSGNDPTKETLTKEDVASLVKEQLTSEQKKALKQQNVAVVKAELEKAWGDSFQSKLVTKTKELGVSQDVLSRMAEDTPLIFLKLVLDKTPSQNPLDVSPPRSSQSFSVTNGVRDWNYFNKLRKENPRAYWSRETQSEIHRLAKEKGKDFLVRR